MIADTESDIGSTWLMSATMPSVASTAVRASRSGMPAATSAPKATTRMISVRGTENSPALFRSSKKPAWTSFPVLVAERPDVEVGIRLLHLVDAVDDGIDDVRGVVRIPAELEPDERGMPVGRDLALVAGVERRLHLRDCVERSDSGDDRLHGPLELRVGWPSACGSE